MNEMEFHGRAQTNIQLYGQLLAAGYGSDEVAGARDAYTLAARLFAGQLRPEGRPFVCHVVGVASILARVEAPTATTIAGLLHSAYTHGDFGRGPGRVTPAACGALRAAVGSEVERLLARYASHPWNGAAVALLRANAMSLERDVRQVALIRLADTIEDALDDGLQLSTKASNSGRAIPRESLVGLANALGFPPLGAALERLLGAPQHRPELVALRDHHAGSYVVCPASWREKLLPRFARLMNRVPAGYRMAGATARGEASRGSSPPAMRS